MKRGETEGRGRQKRNGETEKWGGEQVSINEF